LADYELFEKRENLLRLRQFDVFESLLNALTELFFDDLVTKLDALVANEDARPRN
jgi:hypothetical protein